MKLHSCHTNLVSIRPRPHGDRRGVSLVELLCTLVLLGVVFSMSIAVMVSVAKQRRVSEQRQVALQHGSNLLERAAAKGWSGLTPGVQTINDAPESLSAMLPDLQQRVEVTEVSEDDQSKRVNVTLQWKNSAGQMVSPVQLCTWVFPLEVSP